MSAYWPRLCPFFFFFFIPPSSPQTIHPSRVFLGAVGQFWEISQQYVHTDIREAVYAELRGVPGPVHWAEALLHWGQRQPGGDVERLLVQAAGAHVPAPQLAVPLHRRLLGVCQQVHRPAKAFWGCAQETQSPGHQGLHRCTDICPGTNGGSRGCQQGFEGEFNFLLLAVLTVVVSLGCEASLCCGAVMLFTSR